MSQTPAEEIKSLRDEIAELKQQIREVKRYCTRD